MAHSPTPQTGYVGSSNPFYRIDRKSPSPPSQQPAINKRDKRRMAIQDQLAKISSSFAGNRDANYRKQLQQYQADINFINNANLYDNKVLLEPGKDDSEETAVADAEGVEVGGHSRIWQEQREGLMNGIKQPSQRLDSYAAMDSKAKTGRHAATFVQDVNDALEQKDVDLVTSAFHFNWAIKEYEKDYKFAVEVADKEHQRLLQSLRQRLIQSVQSKKVALHRDKEKLDIADTNALLHHPNQFGINSTASPGGPASNRKTRHTRHRLDADDLDTAILNNSKRKRKAAADENGSPGPSQNAEPSNVHGHKDALPRLEIQSAPPTVYTIERLFSDRELNANLQQATYDVIQSRSTVSSNNVSKRRKPNLAVPPNADSLFPNTADHTDNEDNTSVVNPDVNMEGAPDTAASLLASTAMDRTPSQLYHATRSAGRLQAAAAPQNTLGELAGRQAAAEHIGTYIREKPRKEGEDSSRAPPLSEQEAQDDMRLMQAAIRREDEEAEDEEMEGGEDDGDTQRRKMLDLALGEEQTDYVGPAGFWDEVEEEARSR